MRCMHFFAVTLPTVLMNLFCPQTSLGTEPFDYFSNSWSVIGLKDYKDGTRITPDNRMLLSDGRELRIRIGEGRHRLSRAQTKTLMEGWLPVVQLAAQDESIRFDITMWATPLPSVKDWRKAFDWPTEGDNYLNWVAIKAANTGQLTAAAEIDAVIVQSGGNQVTSVDTLSRKLKPGETAQMVLRIPFQPLDSTVAAEFGKEEPAVWLARTVRYWKDLILKAGRITVPCEKSTQALLAAHVCQLIANDYGQLRGGEGFYDEFYIRDGAYQVMELEEAALADAAEKAIRHYLATQRPDGRFETQKGQFDANGQAVWALWQYYKITGDRAWLEEVYPQMKRAVDWTMRARRQAPADSPFAGVLPAAVADGEYLWDGKHHIVGYDFWNLRGMLCTADAASILGKTADRAALLTEIKEYRTAIEAAWKRTELDHFPPSWEKAGTHWGNTETLWPTALFDVNDPRMAAMQKEVRERHGGGFLEGIIRWTGLPDAIHPYMSAYTTMAALARGEHDQVVEDYYWYLLHSSATQAFPEGIFYKRRFAWGDTIPHCTGAANYAIMLRHMLIHEQENDLHLLAGAPDGWLAEGKEIRIERAPTHFGPVDMLVNGTAKGVLVQFKGADRQKPGRIVLHLPVSRPLDAPIPGVTVATRPDQQKQWDFAGVVDAYAKTAPPLPRLLRDLVDLPAHPPVPVDRCVLLDLSEPANTDPFTAPFGVPNPGEYLFTGLPVGDQTICGIPFRIIDPSTNKGRGFIVLASDKAPADRKWPTQVEIPVSGVAKRAFFLGNVTGWGSHDSGAGEWGAVGAYEIEYADGQKQVVPLITGDTCEDWTSAPSSPGVTCGLRGKPWHLNVLGVNLRQAELKRIVFCDYGTPAAPVLAAVTIER
ncbi:MAG: hypothetical protein ACUVXJ_14655 [Phycisphaerae bacterium]